MIVGLTNIVRAGETPAPHDEDLDELAHLLGEDESELEWKSTFTNDEQVTLYVDLLTSYV